MTARSSTAFETPGSRRTSPVKHKRFVFNLGFVAGSILLAASAAVLWVFMVVS
jgi:hypothetical protein